MRTLWLITVSALALSGWAHEENVPQVKAPVELITPEAVSEFLNEEASQLPWPETVLKKELGAQIEGKRMYVYAIITLKSMERKEIARLVTRAAGVFASAIADNAQIHKATVTFKCPGHTARIFIPVPALKVLSEDMDDHVSFTFEQKKNLVRVCDWFEIDHACDECERLAFVENPTPEPPTAGILQRLVLKNDRWIEAANLEELNGCYLLTDDKGVFIRLRCTDVKRIIPPDPRLVAAK